MRGTYQPSPMCEFLGRPAPGESIDWENLDWDALEAAEAASKTITYRCGHTGPIPRHIAPFAAPAYRVWAGANQDCGECFLDKRASDAAVQGESCGLAPLTGSYKQVRWAITIRKARLEEAEALTSPLDGRQQKSLEKRLAVIDASWWINTRDLSLDEFAAFKLPRRKAE